MTSRAKKTLTILACAILAIGILREVGVISFQWAGSIRRSSSRRETKVPPLNGRSVDYRKDTGTPFIPEIKLPEDAYKVTVSYRITKKLSPFRWVPLFKWGKNEAQLTYFVWMENGLIGSGYISLEAEQTTRGIASARDYELAITEPLVEEMKDRLEPLLGFRGVKAASR